MLFLVGRFIPGRPVCCNKNAVAFYEISLKCAILARFSANGTLIRSYSVTVIITVKTVLWSFRKRDCSTYWLLSLSASHVAITLCFQMRNIDILTSVFSLTPYPNQ